MASSFKRSIQCQSKANKSNNKRCINRLSSRACPRRTASPSTTYRRRGWNRSQQHRQLQRTVLTKNTCSTRNSATVQVMETQHNFLPCVLRFITCLSLHVPRSSPRAVFSELPSFPSCFLLHAPCCILADIQSFEFFWTAGQSKTFVCRLRLCASAWNKIWSGAVPTTGSAVRWCRGPKSRGHVNCVGRARTDSKSFELSDSKSFWRSISQWRFRKSWQFWAFLFSYRKWHPCVGYRVLSLLASTGFERETGFCWETGPRGLGGRIH